MARTVDRAAHSLRRDAFIDAAQSMIATRGYEQLSVQDVLDATDASKGAFYHYFDSKADLLEAVVERMTNGVLVDVAPFIADPSVPAIEKLQGLFGRIASWKNARKELLRGLIETWYSDENIVVREKFKRDVSRRLEPVLAQIIEQGNAEGTFSAGSPQRSAEVLVTLLLGLNDRAGRLYLDRHAGRISFEEVEAAFGFYDAIFGRVLGVPAGQLSLVDQSDVDLREWF
ncbi:MAG TPA: TetR/AcrR family transcriptional regulator [Candidatus Limnocylindria bacterium]|jgi:AcrR family transcriptional regulator|nr:TetR/AcrR family transcriptional regulator [Candidatus Limnocylindria bacterium]